MLTNKEKQDYEINTFKRIIKQIKTNYPKYKFFITRTLFMSLFQSLNYVKKT